MLLLFREIPPAIGEIFTASRIEVVDETLRFDGVHDLAAVFSHCLDIDQVTSLRFAKSIEKMLEQGRKRFAQRQDEHGFSGRLRQTSSSMEKNAGLP